MADLVAGRGGATEPGCRCPALAAQQLVGAEHGLDREQPKAINNTGTTLDRVLDLLAQQLVAAADPEDRTADGGTTGQRHIEPLVAQRLQVGDGRLRAGDDDKVGALDVCGRARVAHRNARLGGQRVEVGEVRHPAQTHDGDVQRVAADGWRGCQRGRLQRERVLRVEPQPLAPRQHADRAAAGQVGQHLKTGREERCVTSELVDEECRDVALVLGVEDRQRADQRGEDAAAVDVADEQHGQAGGACKAHVGQVALAQVDLGGRAGALADDDVEASAQGVQRVEDRLSQRSRQPLVGARGRLGVGRAHQQDLRRRLPRGLDQHGVHRGFRLDAAGGCLHRLRATDLGTRRRHRRVVGHVLGLERRDPHATAGQRAADAGGHQRLAGVRRGPADQEGAAMRGALPSR